VDNYTKEEIEKKLKSMMLKVTKSTNSYYDAVRTGAAAAKGTDEWIIQKMKARVTKDHYWKWFQIMMEGSYKQKKTARNYAKHLLGI